MSQLINSIRWVSVSQAAKIGFQLISVVVLARILPPSDYGVMAMASVVVTLLSMLREMGTGTAIIQKKVLTASLQSTVFWLNVGMGIAIAVLLAAFSPLISAFFKEPQLLGVLCALALIFPLTSLTTVHAALVERRSEFKTIAIIEIASQGLGLAFAVLAALNGAGVYSLVIHPITSSIVSSIWYWKKSGWRPTFTWNKHDFNDILGFTGNLTGFNFINYFARNADSFIIGKFLGATPLGGYAIAYKLMLFPVQNLAWVVTRVLLPTLSSKQDQKAEARELYLKALVMIVTITSPMMLGMWALREPFTHTLFGNKWDVIIPLLAWMAPVGLIQSMLSTSGTVFTALGRTDLLFRLGIGSTLMIVSGFIIGVQFGLIGVVVVYLISNILNMLFIGYFVLKILQLSPTETIKRLAPAILSGMIMAAIIVGFNHAFQQHLASWPAMVALITGTLLGALSYALLLTLVFKQSLQPLLKLLKR